MVKMGRHSTPLYGEKGTPRVSIYFDYCNGCVQEI